MDSDSSMIFDIRTITYENSMPANTYICSHLQCRSNSTFFFQIYIWSQPRDKQFQIILVTSFTENGGCFRFSTNLTCIRTMVNVMIPALKFSAYGFIWKGSLPQKLELPTAIYLRGSCGSCFIAINERRFLWSNIRESFKTLTFLYRGHSLYDHM